MARPCTVHVHAMHPMACSPRQSSSNCLWISQQAMGLCSVSKVDYQRQFFTFSMGTSVVTGARLAYIFNLCKVQLKFTEV